MSMDFIRRRFAELGRCPSTYMKLRCDGRYGHYTPHSQLVPNGETVWPNHDGELRRQLTLLGFSQEPPRS